MIDFIRIRSFIAWPCGLIFLVFLAAVLLWGHPSISKTPTQTITASATSQSRVSGVAKVIMGQAYRALGLKLKVECFPGKRALYKSNQGQTDAELNRVKLSGTSYPNLIRVPEAIFKVRGMAYVWDKNLAVRSKQDLRGHRVGIVRGIKWVTEFTEGLSPKNVSTAYDLFKLLAQQKIDIALEADFTGHEALKSFLDRGIVIVGKPMIELPVYHYVHKKNRHLVEPLNRELEKMNRLGEIDKIIHRLFKESSLPMC